MHILSFASGFLKHFLFSACNYPNPKKLVFCLRNARKNLQLIRQKITSTIFSYFLDFLGIWRNLVIWVLLFLTMITTVSVDPNYFDRLNNEMVFQAETELLLAKEDCVHTFEIR